MAIDLQDSTHSARISMIGGALLDFRLGDLKILQLARALKGRSGSSRETCLNRPECA